MRTISRSTVVIEDVSHLDEKALVERRRNGWNNFFTKFESINDEDDEDFPLFCAPAEGVKTQRVSKKVKEALSCKVPVRSWPSVSNLELPKSRYDKVQNWIEENIQSFCKETANITFDDNSYSDQDEKVDDAQRQEEQDISGVNKLVSNLKRRRIEEHPNKRPGGSSQQPPRNEQCVDLTGEMPNKELASKGVSTGNGDFVQVDLCSSDSVPDEGSPSHGVSGNPVFKRYFLDKFNVEYFKALGMEWKPDVNALRKEVEEDPGIDTGSNLQGLEESIVEVSPKTKLRVKPAREEKMTVLSSSDEDESIGRTRVPIQQHFSGRESRPLRTQNQHYLEDHKDSAVDLEETCLKTVNLKVGNKLEKELFIKRAEPETVEIQSNDSEEEHCVSRSVTSKKTQRKSPVNPHHNSDFVLTCPLGAETVVMKSYLQEDREEGGKVVTTSGNFWSWEEGANKCKMALEDNREGFKQQTKIVQKRYREPSDTGTHNVAAECCGRHTSDKKNKIELISEKKQSASHCVEESSTNMSIFILPPKQKESDEVGNTRHARVAQQKPSHPEFLSLSEAHRSDVVMSVVYSESESSSCTSELRLWRRAQGSSKEESVLEMKVVPSDSSLSSNIGSRKTRRTVTKRKSDIKHRSSQLVLQREARQHRRALIVDASSDTECSLSFASAKISNQDGRIHARNVEDDVQVISSDSDIESCKQSVKTSVMGDSKRDNTRVTQLRKSPKAGSSSPSPKIIMCKQSVKTRVMEASKRDNTRVTQLRKSPKVRSSSRLTDSSRSPSPQIMWCKQSVKTSVMGATKRDNTRVVQLRKSPKASSSCQLTDSSRSPSPKIIMRKQSAKTSVLGASKRENTHIAQLRKSPKAGASSLHSDFSRSHSQMSCRQSVRTIASSAVPSIQNRHQPMLSSDEGDNSDTLSAIFIRPMRTVSKC